MNILVLTAKSAALLRGNRRVHSHEPRTFCRTVRRVTSAGEVKDVKSGAEGKPSLNRAIESAGVDPKPGDLPMSRLKLP